MLLLQFLLLLLQLLLLLLLPRHPVRGLAQAQALVLALALALALVLALVLAQAAPALDPAAPKTPYMLITIQAQDSKKTPRTPEIRRAARQALISRLTSMGVPMDRTTRVVHWMLASARQTIINPNTHINHSIYTISSIANKPPKVNGTAFYTWETTPTLLTSTLYRPNPIYPLLRRLDTI